MDNATLNSALKNKQSITHTDNSTTVTITTDCEISGAVNLAK